MTLLKPFLAAALGAAFVTGAAAAALTPDSPDPFLWLNEIGGAGRWRWAKEQTTKSLAASRRKAIPPIRRTTTSILKVLDANDRIARQALCSITATS